MAYTTTVLISIFIIFLPFMMPCFTTVQNHRKMCDLTDLKSNNSSSETFNPITQRGGQKWTVNLNGHYCQCGRYSALHYPCSHIIVACGYVSMNYYQYIDVVYTNELKSLLRTMVASWE